MKKTAIGIIFFLIISLTVLSQTPQSFNYQAVLRDASGQVLANQQVEISISILQGSASGFEVFSETHSTTTNNFGLANLIIGSVNPAGMETVDWSAGPYFVQVSVGGVVMGTSPLLSVPYALHALTVEIDAVDDADADPTNELQDISLEGHELSITEGSTVTLPDEVDDDDADPTNEIQILSISGDTIFLSGGGFAILPAEADPLFSLWDKSSGVAISESQITDLQHFTNADETDPVFETSLAKQITASDTTRWGEDADPTNELQVLSIKGDTVYLSEGGSAKLPAETDPLFSSWDKSSGVAISESQITDLQHFTNADETDPVFETSLAKQITASDTFHWGKDADPTNELQFLSISNDTIYLTNGGFVRLPFEADPLFSSWDKSMGVSISESQITDLQHFKNSDETDPVFGTSLAKQITASDTTHWGLDADPTNELQVLSISNDTIYLTNGGFVKLPVETDPLFSSWDKSSGVAISESQITDLKHFTNADESDPAFGTSLAKQITASDTTRWGEDADPTNELQVLSIKGDTLYLSEGGSAKLPAESDPLFSSWDKSSGISISESQITDLQHFTNDDETDPVFETSLAKQITASDTSRWGEDADPNNELQFLSISNDTIYLTNGGFVKLPAGFDGSFTSLSNIPPNIDIDSTDDFDGQYNSLSGVPQNVSEFNNDAGYITNPDDADADPTNELQDISLSGTDLSISDGSTVDLSVIQDGTGTDDQRLAWLINNRGEMKLGIENANSVDLNFVKDGTSWDEWAGNKDYVAKWGSGGYLQRGSIFDNGDIGIGTATPGAKLEVAGQVKITGGSPGAGKVLTSDAEGLASWENNIHNTLDEAYDQGGAGIGRTITADAGAFEVAGTDGALFGGTYGSGTLPASGAGTRMMWYPKKAAFRAGYVDGTQWDDANIGDYSVAMGIGTIASGDFSTAIGDSTTASGYACIAMGDSSVASGFVSTAMGYRTIAYEFSTAMGSWTTARWLSTAMGSWTTASGLISTAMGTRTIASGQGSTAMGSNTTAVGFYSTAMGYFTKAESYIGLAIGRYNIGGGTSFNSWVATDPLFEIGIGTDDTHRANAVTVLKNGNTGIGTATPDYTLQVDGDIVPETDGNRNLGSNTLGWYTLFLSSVINYNSDLKFSSGGEDKITISNGGQIKNILDPTDAQDAATKFYADSLINSLITLLYKQGALKVTDYDGNEYDYVVVGEQFWLAENLITTTYNDGTPIPKVTNTSAWSNLVTDAYCWFNNDSTNNEAVYGKLYNWYAVNTGKLCPVYWRMPTDADWAKLGSFLGGNSGAGGKLKETGTAYWNSPNTGATNETGFSARGAGYRWNDGTFMQKKNYAVWWSSTVRDANYSWMRAVFFDENQLYRDYLPKKAGFSIRCVRDL